MSEEKQTDEDKEDEFDPEFRQLVHKLITERLAQEALAGRSWRSALEQIKDILNVDPREIEGAVESAVESLRKGEKSQTQKPHSGQPEYGEYVRNQVFEVVVRQGLAGAPWRDICATPLKVNKIDPEDVQKEIDIRRKKLDGK